ARIFALVYDALQALHHNGVPAGELGAEHLIFASAEKSAGGSRTVRLVNAGFPRHFFDSSALGIGGRASPAEGPQRRGEGSDGPALDAPPQREEALWRLGLLLYRSVTGQQPAAGPAPSRGGRPLLSVRKAAPEVPGLLADLIDSLVDAVPANRPQSAAAVAKALRVFLRTEEEQGPAPVEERVVAPVPGGAAGAGGPGGDGGDQAEVAAAAADLLAEFQDWRRAPGVAGEPAINKFFRAVIKHEGSDLHLAAGLPPMLRLRNVIRPMGAQPLEPEDLEELV